MNQKIEQIQSIEDISTLLLDGVDNWYEYGYVRTQTQDDLTLFNYTKEAQYQGNWNFFEKVSRGLILNNKTGECVARPFDKIHNWLEGGRRSNGHIVNVAEKSDGSLGILYTDPHDKKLKIATRGSFTSDQALWATDYLQKNYRLVRFNPDYTYLFEIIYPENRIVVDYGDREDLVLLAIRNRHTGAYLPYFPDVYTFGVGNDISLPKTYKFNDIAEILAATGSPEFQDNYEGWVVEFSDGQRFKFKTDQYIYLHRLVTHMSFKRVLKAMEDNTIQDYISGIPDEFLGDVYNWMDIISNKVNNVIDNVEIFWDNYPKYHDGSIRGSRKEFAQAVFEQVPHLSKYLFAKLDGKEYISMIYKTEDFGVEEGGE